MMAGVVKPDDDTTLTLASPATKTLARKARARLDYMDDIDRPRAEYCIREAFSKLPREGWGAIVTTLNEVINRADRRRGASS